MFATVFKMQIKPGRENEVLALSEAWNRDRAPQVKGFISSCTIKNGNREGEYLGLTVFDSKENFYQNAADPVQHDWYVSIRGLLESDPEWNDGPVISITL